MYLMCMRLWVKALRVKENNSLTSVAAHAYNPSTQKSEVEGFLAI